MWRSDKDQTGAGTTRRAMLSRAGLLTLGAFGLGAASGTAATREVAEDGAPKAMKAPRRRTRRLTLRATGVHFTGGTVKPGRIATRDDVAAPFGTLRDRRDRRIGGFHAAALPGSGGQLEFHRFELETGTILGMGSGGLSGGGFAVVGGTGRFAGATGSYVARQAGGVTEFDLTLTS